jgi:hypothetical protein
MKPRISKKRNQAMDIVDLLVIIGIIAVLATMIILCEIRLHFRPHPVAGSGNLKQAKLFYHIVESGYNTRYPMAVSATPPEFRNETMIVNSPSRFP